MASLKGDHSIGPMEVYEPEDKSFSKHTFTQGTGETTPNEGSTCMVHLIPVDKIEIDESHLAAYEFNKDVEVILGEGDTPFSELLDRCVESMKEGERAYIKTKVNIHGEKLPDFDMKKGDLKFNIILKSFSRAADQEELEPDEKLERGQHHKNKGSELYQKGNIKFSIKRFNRALKYLNDIEQNSDIPQSIIESQQKLIVICFLNLGACYLKEEKYEQVLSNCSLALERDGDNVKGLFRRGQAYVKLNDYDKARVDLALASKLEPKNKAVANELINLERLFKKEKAVYQNMFKTT